MSITLEECIKMLNSYAKSARNIAKDCLNKDGRHKLIKTAEKYEQEAEWLKELVERRKQPVIVYCKDCKHYKIDHPKANGYHCCYRCHNIFPMKETDFCSRAEKRYVENG